MILALCVTSFVVLIERRRIARAALRFARSR